MGAHDLLEKVAGVNSLGNRRPERVSAARGEIPLVAGIPVAAVLAVVCGFSQVYLKDGPSEAFVDENSPPAVLTGNGRVTSLLKDTQVPGEVADPQVRLDVEGILSPVDVERVKALRPLVEEIASAYGVPADYLLAQIAVESQGKPDAVSEAGAAGVMQIMPWLTQKYGVDATDTRASIDLAAKILRDECERFGSWGLAFWSWHAGDTQVYWALATYGRLEYGVNLPEINVSPVDDSEESVAYASELAEYAKLQYRRFAAQFKITPIKLRQNETIQEAFSGPGADNTLDYWPRILAANQILTSPAP